MKKSKQDAVDDKLIFRGIKKTFTSVFIKSEIKYYFIFLLKICPCILVTKVLITLLDQNLDWQAKVIYI